PRRGAAGSEQEEPTVPESIRDWDETDGPPYVASARLWDDGIIDPQETRNVLAQALMAALTAPIPDSEVGIGRMYPRTGT
ncbi:methylcrotonoyl-CoA carboxylase, partial [Vibrio parahaemolyticus]|nr:methylcrotonoyl-CoA carboxylase [Vibrio parahaemolyticus]